ncbi:hypothetical protein EJ04DRAFT_512174 [Polyplosphaeria fusca]|uniref:Mso1 N-terminal domain-containing protein n=1 Tax=Polyplosphaeria fusca TaxID=682080 RepID=A0A9P4R135_9PLEO|nr:hypothetical protein EJ04DRAFT_512174 [Polyplosphaeria fusca]
MSSYFSNLLTNTTSRYTSLRRTLLSDEADGDTEDDTHISRVLRTYYTEKGRPFPPWLPPDPKAPQQTPPVFVSSAGRQQAGAPPMGRGGANLSDLWDAPAQPQQQQQEPPSLRRAHGRGGGGGRFQPAPESQLQSRPLPSQRAGSYQSASSFNTRPPAEPSPPPSSGSGATAQERLKARLWGSGRSSSPSQSAASSASTSPSVTPSASGMRSPFDRSNQPNRPPYPEDRNSGYSTSSGGGGRQQNSSAMSANSPWSGNDDPYAPPSSGYGGSQSQRPSGGGRVGLPSGPRMR